jgi:hypothetical protein
LRQPPDFRRTKNAKAVPDFPIKKSSAKWSSQPLIYGFQSADFAVFPESRQFGRHDKSGEHRGRKRKTPPLGLIAERGAPPQLDKQLST